MTSRAVTSGAPAEPGGAAPAPRLHRPSKKWLKQAEVYLFFAREFDSLDRSEEAAQQMFEAESRGAKHDLSKNAYAVGKHLANIQVDEWKAGIADGLFHRQEFLEDSTLPTWWVEKVLA